MGLEIERKFLVVDSSCIPADSECCDLVQGYLTDRKDCIVRVRLAGDQGFLTVKGKTRGATRLEYEYPIPETDARHLLRELCLEPLIEKKRYTFRFNGLRWEVDLFAGRNQGLEVAEIELESESQTFRKPPWIGREVTHDPRYFNSNLIKQPYDTWKRTPGH